jgi:hypothetical protein
MKKHSDGKDCENFWKTSDKNQGCKIFRTGIGSDYLKLCPGEKPTLVEVKDGCHSISPTQRVTRDFAKKIGLGYEVKRCNCDL